MVINALTIDFEDWFCVSNLSPTIRFEDWGKCESRIRTNASKLLDVLDKHKFKATFFVLGWIAERFPDLIYSIDKRGHEIASHGYSHIPLSNMSRVEFDLDLKKAIKIKRDIINKEITGYRSPSFSITPKTSWAFEILVNNGIKYDSSVFPTSLHPEYGYPGFTTEIQSPVTGLLEIPLNVMNLFGISIPYGGGGYFRLYPYYITEVFLKKRNRSGKPFVFYLHPWEIDYEQPRVRTNIAKYFRHYCNLKSTFGKFERVLQNYSFTTIRELLLKEEFN